MNEFDKLISLTEDDRVELGASFKELLNTWLHLGMSRFVCRNGTLSDGHEKLTSAQRYAQAIREMYTLANSIRMQKANAMEARADILDAESDLKEANTEPQKLRAQAALMRAQEKLTTALVSVEDQLRQLDEFNAVRCELESDVLSKYKSIEDAELDNWRAVAKYRGMKRQLGYVEHLTHVPLPKEEKAKLGLEIGNPELVAWASLTEPDMVNKLVEDRKALTDETETSKIRRIERSK